MEHHKFIHSGFDNKHKCVVCQDTFDINTIYDHYIQHYLFLESIFSITFINKEKIIPEENNFNFIDLPDFSEDSPIQQFNDYNESNLSINEMVSFNKNLICFEKIINKKYPPFIENNNFNCSNLKKIKFINIKEKKKEIKFKNDFHKQLYKWKLKFNEGDNSTEYLLSIIKNHCNDAPTSSEFYSPLDNLIEINDYKEYRCKFSHKLLVLNIENEINRIFSDITKCKHLNFVFYENGYTKNYYETENYKKIYSKSLIEKKLYLLLNLYSDGFRKGRFSKSSLIGTYFSILNFDINFMTNNICLINLCNECDDCINLKNKDIVQQLVNLNKGNLLFFL